MLAKVPLVQVLVEAIELQLHMLNVFTERIFPVPRRLQQYQRNVESLRSQMVALSRIVGSFQEKRSRK